MHHNKSQGINENQSIQNVTICVTQIGKTEELEVNGKYLYGERVVYF